MADDLDNTLAELRPPSISRGDVAMLSRVEERLFGSSRHPEQRIAHFTIVERIGSGGMGVVYAAQDERLERRVALKLVGRKNMSAQGRARLLGEARALAKLSHPNVVQVYEVGEHDDEVYLAMELVEGQHLGRWQLERRHWRAGVDVYRKAGAGLHAAHVAGIVHCDFKPTNVLIADSGEVKVADFGLARGSAEQLMITTELSGTEDGTDSTSVRVVGTMGYIAPELWQGAEPDARSDQFAFCVSLWETLNGRRPFADTRKLPDRIEVQFQGPAWLRRIVARGLAADPRSRWDSVAALVHELDSKPRRRRRAAAVIGGVTVLGAALWPASPEPLCAGDPRLAIWTPSATIEIRTRFDASDEPGAEASAAVIVAELQARQARWDGERNRLCEAHHDGAVSDRGLDLGQSCLERGRIQAALVRDALLDSSTLDLDFAERMLDVLPDPAACLDTAALASRPAGLGAMLVASALERELAELRVAFARGDHAHALALSDAHIDEPGASAAEALLVRARILSNMDDHAKAHATFREANRRAALAGAGLVAFEAQLALAEFSALTLENPLDARSWLSQAQTTWTLLGEPARLAHEHRFAEASVLEAEGERAKARRLLDEIVEELAALEAPTRELDNVRLRLANLAANDGDHDQAVAIYTELLARREAQLGPTHPTVGTLAFNIGDSLAIARAWAEARTMLERALTIQTAAHGSESARVAAVATRLAEVEIELGNHARAVALARAAWATQQRVLEPENSEYGSPLIVLAWAFAQSEQWALAHAAYTELLALLEPDVEQQAGVHQTLAWLLCRQGQYAEADAHVDLGLRSEDVGVRLAAAVTAGEVELARSQPAAAVDRLRRVLAELPRVPVDQREPLEAEASAVLGLALVALGDEAEARRYLLNATALEQHLVSDLHQRATEALVRLEGDEYTANKEVRDHE